MSQPLDGPRFKVCRATEEIQTLRSMEKTFQSEADYEIVRGEFDPRTGHFPYYVRAQCAPPLGWDWGVTIGEVAHNLRSVLDNLTWQLALLNTSTPDPRTQFPIYGVGKSSKKTPSGNPVPQFAIGGRRDITSLDAKHQEAIEKLQPYHFGSGYKSHPLFRLSHINNADKHRVIQVVAAKAASYSYGTWGDDDPELSGALISFPILMLEDGVKILQAAPHVHVNKNLFPLVAFWDGCPQVKGRGVCGVLSQIAEHVSSILDRFGPDFP